VVDLGHRAAQFGEVCLLPEGICHHFLHACQRILRPSYLVAARRGRQAARPASRIAAELFHANRHAFHRTHNQHVEHGIDQDCRDEADDQRQSGHAPGEGDKGRLQRRLRHHEIDHPRFICAFSRHHQNFARRGKKFRHCAHGAAHHVGAPQVYAAHRPLDRRGRSQQLEAHVVFGFGHSQQFGSLQQARGKFVRHFPHWRRFQCKRSDAGGGGALFKPLGTKTRS